MTASRRTYALYMPVIERVLGVTTEMHISPMNKNVHRVLPSNVISAAPLAALKIGTGCTVVRKLSLAD